MSWSLGETLARFRGNDCRKFGNLVLPPLRLRTGGRHFRADASYLASARHEAERLVQRLALPHDGRILDLGCGAGRLAIGLSATGIPFGRYEGIDVDASRIEWCRRWLAPRDARFRFEVVDVANERYNPAGRPLEPSALVFYQRQYDVIYLYSVLSHMLTEEARQYLLAFRHCLAAGGRIFVTAFVEDGVPDCQENPPDYGPMQWRGRLHCVRFNRTFFEQLLAESGWTIDAFVHGQETDGQSAYYLRHAT